MKQYKNIVQTTQNTVNASIHITKTPTHTHPHITKQVKTTTTPVKLSTRYTQIK